MATDDHRLADFVSARRRELGLTRAQVHAAGGPSRNRLASIEDATGPELSASTFQKLDTGLQWATGSARAIYLGGTPTPLASTDDALVGAANITVSVEELADLIRATNQLVDAHANAGVELAGPALAVQQASSMLAGRWVTDVLERNRLTNSDIPPIVEIAFDHLIDAPIADVPEPERTERLYRRWLIGRTASISDSDAAQFVDRLNSKRTAG
ncbi:MAG: hypothetical protein L0H59_01090 [Tomitella sp.]|nr:hypothetical protein [Tomitella sp.]